MIQASGIQLLSWENGSVRKEGNENCLLLKLDVEEAL